MEFNLLDDVRKLTIFIYNIKFPEYEKYGLMNQIRRAMISVLLNIREGNTYRDGNRNKHFDTSIGSLNEVDECMIISISLKYITQQKYDEFKEMWWKVLNVLRKIRKI